MRLIRFKRILTCGRLSRARARTPPPSARPVRRRASARARGRRPARSAAARAKRRAAGRAPAAPPAQNTHSGYHGLVLLCCSTELPVASNGTLNAESRRLYGACMYVATWPEFRESRPMQQAVTGPVPLSCAPPPAISANPPRGRTCPTTQCASKQKSKRSSWLLQKRSNASGCRMASRWSRMLSLVTATGRPKCAAVVPAGPDRSIGSLQINGHFSKVSTGSLQFNAAPAGVPASASYSDTQHSSHHQSSSAPRGTACRQHHTALRLREELEAVGQRRGSCRDAREDGLAGRDSRQQVGLG
jgi:hypothetical protein